MRSHAGKIITGVLSLLASGIAALVLWGFERASKADVEARAGIVEKHIAEERAMRIDHARLCDLKHDKRDRTLIRVRLQYERLDGKLDALLVNRGIDPSRLRLPVLGPEPDRVEERDHP